MEVWTLWNPTYWLAGNVKLLTAIASVGTAMALPPLVPRIRSLLDAEERAERQTRRLAEQSNLLAEEQAARERAEQADRAKDQFLAMVSHELRAPLSPVLAWSRMLLMGALPKERERSAVEAIVRNATAQAQLIEDLLDVSRIVTGKLRLDVRPIALATVIEAAIDSVRPSADARGIRLQVVLDPGGGRVLGDPDRLQQVVWNLLSNAIKFTPRGGRVQVSLQRVNSHLEIAVADTGIGLGADALAHVFERFWQADAGATRRHGGMGLGLSIVRHLVELHGGAVRAFSDGANRGATFVVELPVMAVAEPPPAAPRDHPAARTADAPARPLTRLDGVRALVVDDDPDSNEMVQTLLGTCGAEVRVAASVRQALAILDRWRPHVLVSDIEMPEEDGIALIAAIRARPAAEGGRMPAVALTAYARVEDRVRILTAGFQLHVSKPVDPSELVAAVAAVVRGRDGADAW
jgi:signal transduction histidine kinase/CheY-like chemotaxis protein